MKSAMVCADALLDALASDDPPALLDQYPARLEKTWVWDELYRARNVRPAFHYGMWLGIAYSAIDTYILRGKAPWTLKNHEDFKQLKPAAECTSISYPKPNGVLTFDKLSSVFLSSTNHEENQPIHLKLKDDKVPTEINLEIYDGPEQRYCPAGVYEFVEEMGSRRLQINAQNCVHCKTCDIKDPTQNINWVVPEGGGGPNYPNM